MRLPQGMTFYPGYCKPIFTARQRNAKSNVISCACLSVILFTGGPHTRAWVPHHKRPLFPHHKGIPRPQPQPPDMCQSDNQPIKFVDIHRFVQQGPSYNEIGWGELSLDEQFVINLTKLKRPYFELPKSALNGSSIFFLGFSTGPASCFLGSAAWLPLSSSRFIPRDRELNMCSGQLGGQYESGSLKT